MVPTTHRVPHLCVDGRTMISMNRYNKKRLITDSKSLGLVVLVCLVFKAGLSGAAVLKGEISAGVGSLTLDNPNAKYGEYSGIKDDELLPLIDVRLSQHESLYSLDFTGVNLGLENRALTLGWRQAGRYGVRFSHSEMPHLLAVDARTPYEGIGTTDLNLPAGFVTGATTGDMTTLADDINEVDLFLDQVRDRFEIYLTPDEVWRFDLAMQRQTADGLKSLGGPIGPSGRVIPTVLVPTPVDHYTDSVKGALSYNGRTAQWEAAYQFSEFNNEYRSLEFDNPFDSQPTYPVTASMSLEPDNRQQTLSLSGGIMLPKTMRLTGSASYSRLEQDDSLLPYTANPASAINEVLPRDSAEAQIDVTNLTLNLAGRPLPRLSLNARYHYHEMDNKTPEDLFLMVPNDAGDQVAIADSGAYYSLPYDLTQNQLKLNGGYYFGGGTTLRLGYEKEITERTNRAVDKTEEDSYTAKVNSRFSSLISVSAQIEQAQRRVKGDYDPYAVYASRHTTDYINSVTVPEDLIDNNPLLSQFDIADRDRMTAAATLNYTPRPDTVVGFYFSQTQDDYPDTLLGLDNSDQRSFTLDLSYSPERDYSVFGYYTWEQMNFDLAGRYFRASGPPGTKSTQAADPDRNWQMENQDDIHTLGIGGTWDLMRGELRLKAKYDYSESANNISIATGPALNPPTDMPTDYSSRHRLELQADYELDEGVNLDLGLIIEKYEADDWSKDGFESGSDDVDEVLTLVGESSDYTAHMIYAKFRYQW